MWAGSQCVPVRMDECMCSEGLGVVGQGLQERLGTSSFSTVLQIQCQCSLLLRWTALVYEMQLRSNGRVRGEVRTGAGAC